MTTTFNPPLPQDTQLASQWQQTFGCATSLALANAAANSQGPLLLICQDNESVEQFKRELRYFCSKLPNKANPVQVFSLLTGRHCRMTTSLHTRISFLIA